MEGTESSRMVRGARKQRMNTSLSIALKQHGKRIPGFVPTDNMLCVGCGGPATDITGLGIAGYPLRQRMRVLCE